MRYSFLAAFAAVALAGCTTYFHNGYQKLTVQTPGVQNADCILETEVNKFRALSFREVLVERSSQPLKITCEKVGYYTASVTVRSEMKLFERGGEWNIFNGLVPGYAYDAASRSIYDYPSTVTVRMKPLPEAPEPENEAPFVLQKKFEPVAVPPAPTPEVKSETEKTLSDSLKK